MEAQFESLSLEYLSPEARESMRHCFAQPPAAAGDENDFTCHIEFIHGALLSPKTAFYVDRSLRSAFS